MKFNLTDEEVSIVEQAYYAYQALQNLMTLMAPGDLYDITMERYMEAFTAYQRIFNAIVEKYAKGKKGKPSIMFSDKVLVVE